MQIPDIQLETQRLLLRPPCEADFEPWAAFMADAERTRFIGGAQARPVAWRGLAAMIGCWAMRGYAMFSVIEKDTGRWVGRLGPWCPEGWPGTEVGWSVIGDVAGKGYATEGATAAIDWAFDTLGWEEVIHTIAPENTASKALAAKLGSHCSHIGKVLPEPFNGEPVEVWKQTRESWFARRRGQGART